MTPTASGSVLVIGATGTQGGAVARHLLHRGVRVRALTRDPSTPAAQALDQAGAEVVTGDLNDPDTLTGPMTGVDGVFSVQDVVSAGDEGEARQGIAVIDAAVKAGVGHFVQASAGGVDRSPDLAGFAGKSQVEHHLGASGLARTVLAPTWFMTDWEWPFFRPGILAGNLALPLDPDTRLQQIAPTDIGRAAAEAFTDPQAWVGRRVELAGDDRTVTDIAAAFSTSLGAPVTYQQVAWDTWLEQYGPFFHGLFRWYQDHGYRADVDARRAELPEMADLDQYLITRGPLTQDPTPRAQ